MPSTQRSQLRDSISRIAPSQPSPGTAKPTHHIVVRMPPVPGAVGSFRTSSPVQIDEEDGVIDIQDFGLASSIMIKQDKPPFPDQNPQSAHTRNSFPIEDFYTHGHIPVRFPKQYLRDNQDPSGTHEYPTSPSHLFVRYHYPQPQQPPLPQHYKYLDRNRTGDLDQSIPISLPLRAQFFSQPTAPVQMTEEDQLSAIEETSSKVQDLIRNAREKMRLEELAREGRVELRVPVMRRVRSRSMSRV